MTWYFLNKIVKDPIGPELIMTIAFLDDVVVIVDDDLEG
jgi:hypothetical protein